jgi:hypothetical protein
LDFSTVAGANDIIKRIFKVTPVVTRCYFSHEVGQNGSSTNLN